MDYYAKQNVMREAVKKMLRKSKKGIGLCQIKLSLMDANLYLGDKCLIRYLDLLIEAEIIELSMSFYIWKGV